MKSRPKNDPTSWRYQANIHGYEPREEPQNLPAWATCQHGNWWFLPWHRAYLLSFEDILRDASGDPALSLPYWDWTDPGQRSLPDRFVDPRSQLFEADRYYKMNAGGELTDSVVQWEKAFQRIVFSAPYSEKGFGGPYSGSPGSDELFGALESLAHNGIHTQVGGLMGDTNTAARDPIFWLHHANLDRLWGEWLQRQGGRANPTDPLWLDTPFAFCGPRGVHKTVTARQVLDTGVLGYRYDTDRNTRLVAPTQPQRGGAPAPEPVVKPPTQRKQLVTLAVKVFPGQELGDEPLTISLRLGQEPRNRLDTIFAAAAGPNTTAPSLQVAIDDIRFDRSPGRIYEVYLNLPVGSKESGPKSPYFAGAISFFGLHSHQNDVQGMNRNAGKGAAQMIDVTDLVRRLRTEGNLRGDLKITLVPQTAEIKSRPGVVGSPPRGLPARRVSIGSIRLVGFED